MLWFLIIYRNLPLNIIFVIHCSRKIRFHLILNCNLFYIDVWYAEFRITFTTFQRMWLRRRLVVPSGFMIQRNGRHSFSWWNILTVRASWCGCLFSIIWIRIKLWLGRSCTIDYIRLKKKKFVKLRLYSIDELIQLSYFILKWCFTFGGIGGGLVKVAITGGLFSRCWGPAGISTKWLLDIAIP